MRCTVSSCTILTNHFLLERLSGLCRALHSTDCFPAAIVQNCGWWSVPWMEIMWGIVKARKVQMYAQLLSNLSKPLSCVWREDKIMSSVCFYVCVFTTCKEFMRIVDALRWLASLYAVRRLWDFYFFIFLFLIPTMKKKRFWQHFVEIKLETWNIPVK